MVWWIGVLIVAAAAIISSKKEETGQSDGKNVGWDYVFDPKYNPNNT